MEKKTRKRRKPMTEEQRAAAAERLAKARAAKKPSENLSIHESIRDLPEDHDLHPDKVKLWIKDWKKRLVAAKSLLHADNGKQAAKYYEIDGYIKNMQRYLDSGVWCDLFWGENRERRVGYVCVAMAYDKHGNPKRTKHTFYTDIYSFWE